VDETVEPFGIRTIAFDPDKGFFLNGKNVKIKGVCLHHDGGCVGAAVPLKIWKLRLEKLKTAGCNAIRTSHNPVAPEFLDLCDQMGFVVMDEAFDEWEYAKRKWINGWNNTIAGYDGYAQYFREWAAKDLKDMVERDKNHPSVILWSIGNEIDYANDPYADKSDSNYDLSRPDAARMLDIAKKLKAVVLSSDTTRPVTMALANVPNSLAVGLPDVVDVTGYNYTESRYEEDHKAFPSRVIYGSENPHSYSSWLLTKKNDYISSQFIWTGVDYLGESGRFPFRSAYSGLLDLTGSEKPIYYWRQSMWSDKPMLSVVARKKNRYDVTGEDPMGRMAWFVNAIGEKRHWNYQAGDSVLVIAYSNCDEVELFVNGKSKGKKTYNEQYSCFWWYVPYEAGEVKAIGRTKGQKELVSMLKTVSEPRSIMVTTDAKEIKADGQDVALIEVKLQDANGNCSYLAKNKVEFEVEGEGKIIGTDNGDAACLDNFKLPWRMAYDGRCIAVVQSNGKAGKILVIVKSEGLPESSVELFSK
jgi:beta-galactosidase